MKLVDNVKDLPKMRSVQAAVAAVLLLVQEIIPLWEGIVPDHTFTILSAAAASLAIVGRAIDQGLKS